MSSGYRELTVLGRIEQAIARGESLDRICERLRVEPAMVDRAMRRMDAAVAADSGSEVAVMGHARPAEPVDGELRDWMLVHGWVRAVEAG